MKLSVNSHIRIPLEDLTQAQKAKIRRLCSIPNSEYEDAIRFNRWISSDTPRHFFSYFEDDNNMVTQRGVLDDLKRILRPSKVIWNTSIFEPVGFEWKEHMEDRYYQDIAVLKLSKKNQGILVAPTGSGKTNIMIKLIEKLQQPTIILVHRNFLLRQWRERIRRYLGYKCGVIGQGRWKIKNITIAMIPTLNKANRKRQAELKKRFGLVIADECHHVPAYTWQKTVSLFYAHYIYGCSATPARKDKLQKLLYHSIGPIRHIISDEVPKKEGSILPVQITVFRTSFVGSDATTRLGFTRMIPSLVENKDRNNLIVSNIIKHKKSRQIVLSDRIAHLKILQKELKDRDPSISSEIVYGAVSEKRRKEIFTKIKNGSIMVMFASSVADEGLDIPELEKLHLTFPTRNTMRNRQQIGRIRRPLNKDKFPEVFDYYDYRNPTLARQYQERRRFYKSEGYTVNIQR